MALTNEQKANIKIIAKKYGINLSIDVLGLSGGAKTEESNLRLFRNLDSAFNDSSSKKSLLYSLNEKVKLARLCLMLGKAIEVGSELEIRTTIKGIQHKVKTSDLSLIENLYYHANTLLYEKYEDIVKDFEDEIDFENWLPIKNKLKADDFPDGYDAYCEPYTEEELNKIIDYEQNKINLNTKSCGYLKEFKISHIVERFKESGVFDTSVKTIKTNEACFIYDSLFMLGIVPELYTNKEKQIKIRDWLRAWKKIESV